MSSSQTMSASFLEAATSLELSALQQNLAPTRSQSRPLSLVSPANTNNTPFVKNVRFRAQQMSECVLIMTLVQTAQSTADSTNDKLSLSLSPLIRWRNETCGTVVLLFFVVSTFAPSPHMPIFASAAALFNLGREIFLQPFYTRLLYFIYPSTSCQPYPRCSHAVCPPSGNDDIAPRRSARGNCGKQRTCFLTSSRESERISLLFRTIGILVGKLQL